MIMACKCKSAENEHIINGSMGPVNVSHCAFGLYILFFLMAGVEQFWGTYFNIIKHTID